MKKIYLTIATVFLALLVLTGCKKPLDPKEGITSYIDTVIYNKDSENSPSDYFNDLKITSTQTSNEEAVAALTNSLELDEAHQEGLKKLEQTLDNNLNQKTSYSVQIEEPSKNKANVTVKVNGLNELDEKKLDELLEKQIKEMDKDITDKTSKEDVAKMSTSISLSSLTQWFESQEKKDSPVEVKTTLIVDPDNKEKWVFQDETSFYEEFVEALNIY